MRENRIMEVVADIYYDLQVSITIKRYIGAFDIRGY